MNEGQTYYLSQDVIGPYSETIYGLRGDAVQLVAAHGDMAIAKGKAGAFPVKAHVLRSTATLSQEPAEEVFQMSAGPKHKPRKNKPAVKAAPTPNTLF